MIFFVTFSEKLFKTWCSGVNSHCLQRKLDRLLRTESTTSAVCFHVKWRWNQTTHPQFPSKPEYEYKYVGNTLSGMKKTPLLANVSNLKEGIKSLFFFFQSVCYWITVHTGCFKREWAMWRNTEADLDYSAGGWSTMQYSGWLQWFQYIKTMMCLAPK